MQDLENTLASQTPLIPEHQMQNNQHELPPLHIDGIPTPVDKMTQVRTHNDFAADVVFLKIFDVGQVVN